MVVREITYLISSKLENLGLIGESIRASCQLADWGDVEAHRIELSVVEALNNVVEHAYEYAPDGKIEVYLRISSESLRVEIRDKGHARPENLSHSLEYDPNDLNQLPEGGMGLFIMHTVMDDVRSERVDGENRLILLKSTVPAETA